MVNNIENSDGVQWLELMLRDLKAGKVTDLRVSLGQA